ncbi:MAG: PqqD family protein [Acidobacteriota bacterium]
MIITAFVDSAGAPASWQADVLETSWRQAAQPGQLVRLTPSSPGVELPTLLERTRHARPVATLPFQPHPYTGDDSPAYLLPAGLLEWLSSERVDGTVLVLEAGSLLRGAITDEVTPGRVIAAPSDLQRSGEGPFGLGKALAFLARVCADQTLEVPNVALPALVHSRDLLRLAPRWLELTLVLREECREWEGWEHATHRLAFAIALAEWGLEVETRQLAVAAAGSEPPEMRPARCEGVREARVLDQMILDVPGQEGSVSLNPSSAWIWQLVDGARTVSGIARQLEQQFDKAHGELEGDVQAALEQLRNVGALDLELVL